MAIAASSPRTGEGDSFGEELAERAGLAVNTISNLERGTIQTPLRDTVRCLGAALDLAAAAARRRHEPAPFPHPATVPLCPYRGLKP